MSDPLDNSTGKTGQSADDAIVEATIVEASGVDSAADAVVVGESSRRFLAAVASRRVGRSVAVSLAFHVAVAGLGIVLASYFVRPIVSFGSNRPVSIAATFADDGEETERPDETGREEIIIKPTEAWQDDRHFINTTLRPPVGHSSIPARTTPRPSLDSRSAERPNERPVEDEARRKTTVARRRVAAVVDPQVAPVNLPPPNFRFVGRPCRYPALAELAGWEGTVVLVITIDPDGKVIDVKIKESSGHLVLDAEAVLTARAWLAVPIKPGAALWPHKVQKPVTFRL